MQKNAPLLGFTTLLAAFGLLPIRGSLAAGDPLPTAEGIRAEVLANQFQAAIQDANRLLTLKGNAAQTIDRGEILNLRGEADLNLRLTSAAVASFTMAAKESTDRKQKAIAIATAALAEKSTNLHYTPKHRSAETDANTQPFSIDILPLDSRKQAFAALYADESLTAAATVKSGLAATSLPPIATALKSLTRLQSLEIASTGSDTQTADSVKALGAHATSLIADALTAMGTKVQKISMQAHTQTQTTDSTGITYTRERGLDSNDISTLKQIILDCQRISAAVTDLDTATDSTDTGGSAAKATSLSSQANTLLNTTWQTSSNQGSIQGNMPGRMPGTTPPSPPPAHSTPTPRKN